MPRDAIGHHACPLCGFDDVEVRETEGKNPKPYMVCEECGMQLFARQPAACRALRAAMRPIPAAVAAIDTTTTTATVRTDVAEPTAGTVTLTKHDAAKPAAAKKPAGLFAGLGLKI